jgi:hypothetical protein
MFKASLAVHETREKSIQAKCVASKSVAQCFASGFDGAGK